MKFNQSGMRGIVGAAAFAITYLTITSASAAGSNMPWEQPLNQILQSVEAVSYTHLRAHET